MTDMHPLQMCRLCLAGAERLGELTHHLIYIISTCFSLKLSMSSEVSTKICQACVDQLENVYKYRKKIIRNELILLQISREGVSDHSVTYSKNVETDHDLDEVKMEIDQFYINENERDEFDSNDSYTAVYDEIDAEIKNKKKDATKKCRKYEQKETEQTLGSNISMWKDLKTDNKQLDNLNIAEADDVNFNESLNNQYEVKTGNPNVPNEKDNKHLIVNKNTLEERTSQIIQPIPLQSVTNIDSNLEVDKENTDMNNTYSNELNDIENARIINCQDAKAGENQDQFYAIDMNNRFMCLTCLKVFESQKQLTSHYKTVELPKAIEMTKKNNDSNTDDVSKTGNGENGFSCNICSKMFDDKASVMKHLQIHKADRPFLCNLCSRTYKTVADIVRHGVVHNGFKFVCSFECGYTTVHLGALREHVKRHKKEFKYKCEKCGKCFQVKTWYEQHQNVHDKVRPFACKLCGQAFSMERYLTSHRANVHPQSSQGNRYKCVQCGLPCDSRKSLVMHMKQKHGMKTDCLCDVCGHVLPDQQKLLLHKSVHDAARKFSCRYCKKTFNRKDHMIVHEKIHTGERLSCNNCPKSFTQRCSLRRHIKRYHQQDQETAKQKPRDLILN